MQFTCCPLIISFAPLFCLCIYSLSRCLVFVDWFTLSVHGCLLSWWFSYSMCLKLELNDYYFYSVIVHVTLVAFSNRSHDQNIFLRCSFFVYLFFSHGFNFGKAPLPGERGSLPWGPYEGFSTPSQPDSLPRELPINLSICQTEQLDKCKAVRERASTEFRCIRGMVAGEQWTIFPCLTHWWGHLQSLSQTRNQPTVILLHWPSA